MSSGLCEQTTFTYEELIMDIERLVSMKSGLYIIPGFDRDDVGQEIRMTCVKALAKYDAAKNNSTPFHFLARCVDNRLRNLLRDNAATLTKAQKTDERAIARAAKKRKLQNSLSVGGDIQEWQLGEAPERMYVNEFREEVESRLPTDVKPSLSLLISNGPPAISKIHLKIIKQVIREVYPDLGA